MNRAPSTDLKCGFSEIILIAYKSTQLLKAPLPINVNIETDNWLNANEQFPILRIEQGNRNTFLIYER